MVKRLNTKFTLGDRLFGAVKLIKNVDFDKYGHSGNGIGTDACSTFSIDGERGKNVVIFSEGSSLSAHADILKKDILVLSN